MRSDAMPASPMLEGSSSRPAAAEPRQSEASPGAPGSERGTTEIYAPPRTVTRLEECYFYHTMKIPGYGEVQGEWDHRGRERAYLGSVALAGKRVLEVGTASGFFCFYMERQGADVVGYDLSEHDNWDVVPYARFDYTAYLAERKAHLRALNNAYWLAHRAHGSRAQVVYGSVYRLPEAIGPVDVCTFGNVLVHLRDPFLALERALRLARETVVVTEALHLGFLPTQLLGKLGARELAFLPDWRRLEPKEAWWILTPGIVRRFLAVLGFERSRVSYHLQRYRGRLRLCFTVVGTRTHGGPRKGAG